MVGYFLANTPPKGTNAVFGMCHCIQIMNKYHIHIEKVINEMKTIF